MSRIVIVLVETLPVLPGLGHKAQDEMEMNGVICLVRLARQILVNVDGVDEALRGLRMSWKA